MPARRSLPAALLLLALLAGCSTATPIALDLPHGETLVGGARTTIYTGTLKVGEGRNECRGTYTGVSPSSVVLLEVHCDNGRYGIGTGVLENSNLVGGRVRMQDGVEVVVRAAEPVLTR